MSQATVYADVSWCCYRYHYAFGRMGFEVEGQMVPTGIYFGFTRFLERIHRELPGVSVVFCVDSWDEKRAEVLPGYKEGRTSVDFSEVRANVIEMVSLCPGVSVVRADGREADDLMASGSFDALDRGEQPYIFSGDDDMVQLISRGVKVFSKFDRSVGMVLKDEAYVYAKFGVEPNLLLRYRALIGDASDKIPPPIKRLNREFARKFARKWAETSFEEAIRTEDPKYTSQLLEVKGLIRRNLELMSLVRFRRPEARITFEDISAARPSIVREYRMYSYLKFLRSKGVRV